ncbi:hypothetical protein RvY_03681-2 [Ramazzottius varieornatus]|uniref:guanylate cyclase n=2 Tax=Ramazzottius varieornatus TaxID=947166 RepID=A0A1D1UNY5_RAMVA|nr:hypothetical protein RvY_03681-2 [Ramazzottius varieornatus]
MHDSSRDLVLAGAQQGVEMKLIMKQETMRTKQLEDAVHRLEKEKSRRQALMYKLLPKTLATEAFNRLEANETQLGQTEQTLETAPNATLMLCFWDIDSENPETSRQVVAIHKHLDLFAERFGYFKIETTQATFMAVSGIPTGTENTEENACVLAKKIVCFASNSAVSIPIYIGKISSR